LIYIDAGGGHRAAAVALPEVIRQQQRPWDLELVAVQDLLSPIDFIRKPRAVKRLLAPESYGRLRARAAAYSNYAVHEIPEMLNGILTEFPRAPGWPPRNRTSFPLEDRH
jgi:hypothetical protein